MTGVPTIRTRANLGLACLFSAFAAAFLWLNLLDPNKRPVLATTDLSRTQIIILILAVVIPYVGIWLVGLVGYIRLRGYTLLVKQTKDGRPITLISSGILGILLSLPVTSLFNSAAQVIQINNPTQALQIRRIGVYVGIMLLLGAFYRLMVGSRMLHDGLGKPRKPMPVLAILGFMLLGGLYIYFVLTNPLFEASTIKGHLPAWVVIDTIVLPRLLAWYWGLSAGWSLYQYSRLVSGRLYRLAFSYLAIGIAVVTLSIALLQYIQAISAVTRLPVGVILLVVYLVLVVISAGFMLLARGGKELAKIEAV